MNNQVPAMREERWRERRRDVAEAMAQRQGLSLDARLDRLEALLQQRKLVAHATQAGKITDERWEADAAIQLAVLKMIHELQDEFPAKALKVDSSVRVEQLVAILQRVPAAQLDQLADGAPALPAAEPAELAEPDDA